MKIICHMIASADGRLLPARWSESAEPVDVTAAYEATARRFPADGWIVGRVTMAEYGEGVEEGAPAELRPADAPQPEPFIGNRNGRPLAVAIDPKGKLRFSVNGLPTGEHLVAVLSPRVGEAHLAALREAGVSYVFEVESEDGREKLLPALEALQTLMGAKLMLLEGGGIINGSFLAAGLIDEISLLIYPGLDAVFGSPSVFGWQGPEGVSPAAGVRLRLFETEVLAGGVVWLHYINERT